MVCDYVIACSSLKGQLSDMQENGNDGGDPAENAALRGAVVVTGVDGAHQAASPGLCDELGAVLWHCLWPRTHWDDDWTASGRRWEQIEW